MIAYLDTHTAIRLAHGRPHLGHGALQQIQKAELLISPMALLEIEYLHEIGRLTMRSKDIQRKLETEIGLRACDLPFIEVARAAHDEKWTHDAFDRIIVAQARLNGIATLISSDEKIAEHYPRTLW